jgi:hypothetical protein
MASDVQNKVEGIFFFLAPLCGIGPGRCDDAQQSHGGAFVAQVYDSLIRRTLSDAPPA